MNGIGLNTEEGVKEPQYLFKSFINSIVDQIESIHKTEEDLQAETEGVGEVEIQDTEEGGAS